MSEQCRTRGRVVRPQLRKEEFTEKMTDGGSGVEAQQWKEVKEVKGPGVRLKDDR